MKKNNKYRNALKSFVSNVGYVVILVTLCTIAVALIWNWRNTLAVLERFISVIMPFIVGFFLAYLLMPLVNFFQKLLNRIKPERWKGVKRGVSIAISYLIVVGLLTVLVVYIFPQIRDSGRELGQTIKKGYQYAVTHEAEINSRIPFIQIGEIIEYIRNNLLSGLVNYRADILPYVYQLSSSVFSMVYDIFFGVVISIYIVWDSAHLVQSLKKVVYALVPKRRAEGAWRTILKCNHIFTGFLFGKTIDSLIIGVICLIAMSILQFPFALLISVIVCITNMIPYFGPFIGAIPGVLIYLFIDPKLSLLFAIMVLVLQQFDGLYLGPKILGDLTGIKPLWVIFGITVGGAYFGVIGMFLGVPATAVLMYLVNLFLEKKLRKKEIHLFDVK